MEANNNVNYVDKHSGVSGKSSPINGSGNNNCILEKYDGDLLAVPGSLLPVSSVMSFKTRKVH